jgi:glycosyltransferase involved in cell wall biosynthesis
MPGGARETIVDGETGLFFPEQSVEALVDAVERCEHWLGDFVPSDAIANARRFAPEVFDAGIRAAVAQGMGFEGEVREAPRPARKTG